MARCSDCGLEIRWVRAEREGRLPVDARATAFTGRRYMLDPNDPEIAVAMNETYRGYGYADHRESCPTKARERERI